MRRGGVNRGALASLIITFHKNCLKCQTPIDSDQHQGLLYLKLGYIYYFCKNYCFISLSKIKKSRQKLYSPESGCKIKGLSVDDVPRLLFHKMFHDFHISTPRVKFSPEGGYLCLIQNAGLNPSQVDLLVDFVYGTLDQI